jgi:hypothetical protein
MKRSDQPVDPDIELGKGDSLPAADKGLLTGMEKSISVDDVGKSPYAVAAKLSKNEWSWHGSLLMGAEQETVMSMTNRENPPVSLEQAYGPKAATL